MPVKNLIFARIDARNATHTIESHAVPRIDLFATTFFAVDHLAPFADVAALAGAYGKTGTMHEQFTVRLQNKTGKLLRFINGDSAQNQLPSGGRRYTWKQWRL